MTRGLRFLAFLFAWTVHPAFADEIKVLAGSAVDTAFAVLIPEFERARRDKVHFDGDGAIGQMAKRVEAGEAVDVLVVSRQQIQALEKQGRLVPGTVREIARMGVGVFVRKGGPKPDISTPETFKASMLSAKSIGYNDPALGAPVSIYLLGLFERIGIAREMKEKTVVFRQRTERFAPVARGEVEIGFNQLGEIMVQPGIDLVGPLPGAIQNYTVFAAAVVAAGRNPDAGKRFVDFIGSADARAVFKSKGFE
jgi:molybdate transport system substrate-binding protein